MDLQERCNTAETLLLQLMLVVKAAIKAGDWQVDGAADPDQVVNAIHRQYSKIVAETPRH